MNTTVNSLFQFNQLESFNFAFKYLWSSDINRRAKLHMVDTIIFKDGLPYYWIFTSDKTGEILKKKDERLKSIPEILKYLKNKNRSFKGYKNSMLKSKIATVWYVEANQKLSCSIVDEGELQAITNNKMSDVICIQSFMSGYPLKGNGIFEHRMWTQKDGGVKHLTYEGATEISTDIQQKCNLFTSQTAGKLIVTENHHNILSSLCNYLIRHFALTASLKVTDLTFQVIFSASHAPYIVYFRKIGISDASSSSYLNENQRINLIYPTGELPFGLDLCVVEIPPSNDVITQTTTLHKQHHHQQQQDISKYPNYTAEVAKKPLERLTKQEVLAKQEVDVTLINEIIATTKPPPPSTANNNQVRRPLSSTNNNKNNTTKYGRDSVKVIFTIETSNNPPPLPHETNSDMKLRLEMESLMPTFGQKPVTYYSKSDLFGIPQDYTKTSLSATLHPHQVQVATKALDDNHANVQRKVDKNLFTSDESRNHIKQQQHAARESFDQVYRPLSASSVSMLRQTIMQSSIQQGGLSTSKHVSKLPSDNNISSKRRQQVDLADINQEFIIKPYEAITEASKFASTFYKRLKDIADGNLKYKDDIFANRRPISAPHPTDSSDAKYSNLIDDDDNKCELNSAESGSTNNKLNNAKSFSIRKILSFSGTSCFGTYCNFDQRAKSAAVGEAKAQVRSNKSNKCHICPHRIAYKSLLLAKAETKFLKTDMDENIESFVDQMKLNTSSVELLYTYFIKKHLNRIAQQCLVEAEKGLGHNSNEAALKEDLNSIYRRLIYHDALQQVHPSRFYYTVPICQMCYNIYTFMDAQREKIVFITSSEKHQTTATSSTAGGDEKKKNSRQKHDKVRPLSAPSTAAASTIKGESIVINKQKSTTNEFEDIFIEDSTANNDFFIPQHTAQRDVVKDNKLSQTAYVRQLAAKFYTEPTSVSKVDNTDPQENMVVAPIEKPSQPRITVVNGRSRLTLRPGQLQKHFQHRKKGLAIPLKVRVPVNSLNCGIYDETCYGNYGIGSRGPNHFDLNVSLPSNPNAKAISGWVKLFANKGDKDEVSGGSSEQQHHPNNADYIHNHGLRSQAEWDHQGAPPYRRPTSSSNLRSDLNTSTTTTTKPNRPHSAQPFKRQYMSVSTSSAVSNQQNVNNNNTVELERCKSQVKFAISDSSESNSIVQNNSVILDNEIQYNNAKPNRPQSAGAVLLHPVRKTVNKQTDHKTRFDSLYDTILYDKARHFVAEETIYPVSKSSLISYDSWIVKNNIESTSEEETTLLSQKLSTMNDHILAFGNNAAYAYTLLPYTDDAPKFSIESQIPQQPILIHPHTTTTTPILMHINNTTTPMLILPSSSLTTSLQLQPPPLTNYTNNTNATTMTTSSQISYTSHSSIDSKIRYKTSQEVQNYHQQYHSQYKKNIQEDTLNVLPSNSNNNSNNNNNNHLTLRAVGVDEPPITPLVYTNHPNYYQAPAAPLIQKNTCMIVANQMEALHLCSDNDDVDELFEKDDYFNLFDNECDNEDVVEDELLPPPQSLLLNNSSIGRGLRADNSSIIPMNLSQNLDDDNDMHISSYKQLTGEYSNHQEIVVVNDDNNNNLTLSEYPTVLLNDNNIPSSPSCLLNVISQEEGNSKNSSPSSTTPMNLSQSLSPFPALFKQRITTALHSPSFIDIKN